MGNCPGQPGGTEVQEPVWGLGRMNHLLLWIFFLISFVGFFPEKNIRKESTGLVFLRKGYVRGG